jgi:hypothetical protein
VPTEIRSAVAKANILIVPTEGYAAGERSDLLFFPAGTSELFAFLKERVAPGIAVEVACGDDNYTEVARHAAVFYLPEFLLRSILAPVFCALLVEYIKIRLGRRAEATTIKTAIR